VDHRRGVGSLNPRVQSGPPQFDETLPFLKLAPDGRVFGSIAECRTAAKLDARIDLQNCTEYFEAERWQPVRLFARSAAWAIVPPLVLLLFGVAVGDRPEPRPVYRKMPTLQW
jgi:hypothetical protein